MAPKKKSISKKDAKMASQQVYEVEKEINGALDHEMNGGNNLD